MSQPLPPQRMDSDERGRSDTSQLDLTVAICTWNRARLLEQTLASLQHVRIPPGVTWEVLVVNNACTDDTDAVVEKFSGLLPLRRLFEPTSGHAHARNCAVREAQGKLLIWTDDDVLVDEAWLSSYVDAARARPSVALFAGKIDPWFEQAPAGWVKRHIESLSGVIVCVDHGAEKTLEPNEAIFGANLAVRLDVARAFPFNVNLGRVKSNLVGGDDTDFLNRVVDAGHECRWLPSARVRHFVPRARIQRNYITRWFRDGGRTFVRRGMLMPSRMIAGMPLWALRKLAIASAKRACFAATGGARWLAAFQESLLLQGIVVESRQASRRPSNGRSVNA